MAYNLFAQDKLQNYPGSIDGTEIVQQPAAETVQPVQTQPAQTTVRTAQRTSRTMPAIDPTSPTAGMDVISQMYTDPNDEDRMRRASVANQRILAVGDALRHIGNIYNTVRYAPAQKFNSPVLEEYSRYQKGKALRDAANLRFLTYQQQRAAQDQKARQWEATFNYNAAKDAATAKALKDYRDAKMKADQDKWKDQLAFNKSKWKDQSDLNERKFKQQTKHQNTMAGIASRNASTNAARLEWQKSKGGGGKGSRVAPLDTPKGQITPSGSNYSNQLLQMYDYAKSKGLVKDTEVSRRLREMGFGKDQSDNVKRQIVMDLLRTDPSLGDYASERLGWIYGGGTPSTNWDEYAEEEDDWSQYEEN